MSSGVVLCGSFGFGNAGDEAVPLAVGDLCNDIGWKPKIESISRFDDPVLPNVIGLSDRYIERRERLRGRPLLFSGGGIIEHLPRATIFRCGHLIKELNPSSVWAFASSVEFGVSYSWQTKRKIRAMLGDFNGIYVRDVLSAEALSDIVPNAQIHTVGDSILGMLSAQDSRLLSFISEPYIAVCLSPQWKDDHHWTKWIVEELTNLSRHKKMKLVYVPMTGKYDDDRYEHNRIASIIAERSPDISQQVIEDALRPREISFILGNAQLTIGMRLHACVFSYSQRTPCVGICYHPKLYGFARTMNIEDYFLPGASSQKQQDGTYGYNFYSSLFRKGMLVDKSLSAMDNFPFQMMVKYKRKLLAALTIIQP